MVTHHTTPLHTLTNSDLCTAANPCLVFSLMAGQLVHKTIVGLQCVYTHKTVFLLYSEVVYFTTLLVNMELYTRATVTQNSPWSSARLLSPPLVWWCLLLNGTLTLPADGQPLADPHCSTVQTNAYNTWTTFVPVFSNPISVMCFSMHLIQGLILCTSSLVWLVKG